jgi:hypothetical protein
MGGHKRRSGLWRGNKREVHMIYPDKIKDLSGDASDKTAKLES